MSKYLFTSESVTEGHPTSVASWTLQVEENNCLEMPVKLREEEFFQSGCHTDFLTALPCDKSRYSSARK